MHVGEENVARPKALTFGIDALARTCAFLMLVSVLRPEHGWFPPAAMHKATMLALKSEQVPPWDWEKTAQAHQAV